ncbi:hypothetical protein TMA_119 [Thermus phage TMA]|uniref:hypothetical protein n=1 Tax=Thermus phage TMA TaxID=699370 RepID=UPI00021AADE7|nr:hypothetical protein TMA_119 [Thermus phage TMA]BAK53807.1 hypothetical protein TMA_119 [Thermus phage TMA]
MLTSYAKVNSAKLSFARKDKETSVENYHLNTSNFSEFISAFRLLHKRIIKELNIFKSLKQKEEIANLHFNAYHFYSVYFYAKDLSSGQQERDFYQVEPVHYNIENFSSLNIKSTLKKIVKKTMKEIPSFYEISFSFYLIYESIKDNYDSDVKTNLEMTIRIARNDPF